MKLTSIGTKLVLKVTIAIVVVMLVFGALNVDRWVNDSEQQLEAKKRRVLEQLTIVVETALWNLDKELIDRTLRSYLIDPDIITIKVLEGNAVVSHLGRQPGSQDIVDLAESSGLESAAPYADIRNVDVQRDGTKLGTISIAFSDQAIRSRTDRVIEDTRTGIIVLVLVIAVLLYTLVRRAITKPLTRIVNAAERMAQGDVDVQLTKVRSRDEIGTLLRAFNEMIDYIQDMAAVAQRISSGDLSGEILPRSERDVLGTAFHNMSTYLKEAAQAAEAIAQGDLSHAIRPKTKEDVLGIAFLNMMRYLQSMADAATRISSGALNGQISPRSSADVLGKAFEQMSVYLREMADAATAIASGDLRKEIVPRSPNDLLGNAFQNMRYLRETVRRIMAESETLAGDSGELEKISAEMASTATRTAEQVQMVSSSSQKISTRAREAATSTEDLSTRIGDLSGQTESVMVVVNSAVEVVGSAQETIAELTVNSEEIDQIINVLTHIAQETNLLAINAEIQAAHAGASARGLGVVATRVRELAEQTASSANDITGRVAAIRSRTSDAMKAIAEVSDTINRVHDISTRMSSAFVEQVATTGRVTTRIVEAADDSEKVNQAILEVATLSDNTSQGVEGVEGTAGRLAAVSGRLRDLMDKFRI